CGAGCTGGPVCGAGGRRKGFTGYWRWKSRSPGGRPPPAKGGRELIRTMRFAHSLSGATQLHGELLQPGVAAAPATASVYMVPRRDRPLQTWKTFLRNHMEGIASIDLFVVPTIALAHGLGCAVTLQIVISLRPFF